MMSFLRLTTKRWFHHRYLHYQACQSRRRKSEGGIFSYPNFCVRRITKLMIIDIEREREKERERVKIDLQIKRSPPIRGGRVKYQVRRTLSFLLLHFWIVAQLVCRTEESNNHIGAVSSKSNFFPFFSSRPSRVPCVPFLRLCEPSARGAK